MAINIVNSTFIESFTRKMAANLTYIEEGSALVSVLENGLEVVKPSTGVANEAFVGFAVSEALKPDFAAFSERVVIPATGAKTVTLARTPVTTQGIAAIIEDGVGAPTIITTVAGTASATEIAVSGKVVTFHASFAGMTVEIRYKYQMTLSEINNAYASDDRRVRNTEITDLGVLSKGTILTDLYDITVDWAAFNAVSNPVTLAANGKVTLGGVGSVLPVHVAGLPYANGGFLALRVNA